jgi:hypothetical protein
MEDGGAALLRQWLARARRGAYGHYAEAQRCQRFHLAIGIPAVALSAIVGTTVFASLSSATQLDKWVQFAIGTISVVAAVLTALQTLLRLSERADQHRNAASQYSTIRRNIEQRLVFVDTLNRDIIDVIRKELDQLAARAPDISEAAWVKVKKTMSEDYFLARESAPS